VQYFRAIYQRYRKAGREAKSAILDEFCRNTGYHRKYAIRLLQGPARLACNYSEKRNLLRCQKGMYKLARKSLISRVGYQHSTPCRNLKVSARTSLRRQADAAQQRRVTGIGSNVVEDGISNQLGELKIFLFRCPAQPFKGFLAIARDRIPGGDK